MIASEVFERLSVQAGNHLEKILQKPWKLFSFFFLLIVALKWPFFTIPPVWDEAFSIFPAADFLVNNGFDYRLLLEQPRYHDGGPTAHGLSLLTLFTALVLKITGGGTTAWMVLHTVQWLMAAAIGAMLSSIFHRVFERIPSFLLAFACLCYPLVLAQLGFMYVEVPVLFFTVLAFYVFLQDRIWLASLFLVVACLTKGSALIGVGALSLTVLFSSPALSWIRRIANAIVVALPSLIAVKVYMTMYSGGQSRAGVDMSGIIPTLVQKNLAAYHGYLALVPEILLLLIAGIVFSLIAILIRFKNNQYANFSKNKVVLINAFFVATFVVFYSIIYNFYQTTDSHFLTRYLAYVIPSIYFMLYYTFNKLPINSAFKVFILLIFIAVSILNRNGLLYPPIPISSIAMAERSEEYINGYLVQKEYTELIEKNVPAEVPVYVSLPDFYLMNYPVSGYVTESLSNIHYIIHTLKNNGQNFYYPDHFFLVYSYPWLGGQMIARMIQDVMRNDEFSHEIVASYERGFFSAYVFEVNRVKDIVPQQY
ncbi:hypothetical protein SAMN06295888_11874 [Desulfonatronum zhilinae]|nr:hypothetical protein SAMN06295888_11874 [Desulfonatronum zhilinae]